MSDGMDLNRTIGGQDSPRPQGPRKAAPMTTPGRHEKAEALLRAHWESLGLNPDKMATLDQLAEGERETWLQRAEAS